MWNGVTDISENTEGGEANNIYADDMKYLVLVSAENWKVSIQAYTYPNEFSECLGNLELVPGLYMSHQTRKHFGLCYKTIEGNDVRGNDYGYKLHIVYDVLASPSDLGYQTISDSPEANEMSWDLSAGTISISGHKPTPEIILNYRAMGKLGLGNILHKIEDILYGTEETNATILDPSQIGQIIDTGTHLCDSDGNFIFDSEEERISSMVYD